MNRTFLDELEEQRYSPLDLLPQTDLREKLVDLAIQGVPDGVHSEAQHVLHLLREKLVDEVGDDAKVIIFGGGTGLSNILGGDSRQPAWVDSPFDGVKNIFPKTRSIVCVTDNGGSTGELLKDLPLIAIGDIRHVLLSSIQQRRLQKKYSLDGSEARKAVSVIAHLFNLRFTEPLHKDSRSLQECVERLKELPTVLENHLRYLIKALFDDKRLAVARTRAHCLGNLLCAAAIYREVPLNTEERRPVHHKVFEDAIRIGLDSLAGMLGCEEGAVVPCSPTPAQLRVLYTNGVEITGEHKLSGVNRGVPIESIEVDYCYEPHVYPEVIADIESADVILFAPGSLYSSIIPVLKVPGLADAVRNNGKALKVLVSNLWVQEGETDLSVVDPGRKFHVSDMLAAYEKNIPGGTNGLFREILCVSLRDIPASILQRYAVEGKVPIYLDQDVLVENNYFPVQCDIFSEAALSQRGVIQHDPGRLALALRALYSGHNNFYRDDVPAPIKGNGLSTMTFTSHTGCIYPCEKHAALTRRMERLTVHFAGDRFGYSQEQVKENIVEILWDHPTIPLSHLDYFADIICISPESWDRDQKWDNVYSFYDIEDNCIKIRTDQLGEKLSLEIAILIALGESLLGNYAKSKRMEDVVLAGINVGRVYHLHLTHPEKRRCFFDEKQLKTFLLLSRMCPTDDENHYTRLVNREEGFTPPGLLMGLMYAWYIDNRLATHIEYKMSVLKLDSSWLIPEQMKMASRRRSMIQFFREVVFQGLCQK